MNVLAGFSVSLHQMLSEVLSILQKTVLCLLGKRNFADGYYMYDITHWVIFRGPSSLITYQKSCQWKINPLAPLIPPSPFHLLKPAAES